MNPKTKSNTPCSLGRRCLAISYDTVVVLALWFAATAVLLPLSGVHAIEPGQQYYFLYWPYLLLVNWFYVALSWRHGNQTLGMKAWRVYLRTGTGKRLSWTYSARRYCVALFGFALLGAGFFSSLLRADKCTWQDRASDSWPVYLKKKS